MPKTISPLLPLLTSNSSSLHENDKARSMKMIKHVIDVRNPGQNVILTADQPVYEFSSSSVDVYNEKY